MLVALVYVLDERLDSRTVVLRVLFDVVVTSQLHEVRFEAFVHTILPQPLGMANVDDFVAHPVNNVDRAVGIEVTDSVNIREFVKPHGPAKVCKYHSQG